MGNFLAHLFFHNIVCDKDSSLGGEFLRHSLLNSMLRSEQKHKGKKHDHSKDKGKGKK